METATESPTPEIHGAPVGRADELVPVVNREARVIQLAFHPDASVQQRDANGLPIVTEREARVLRILPGLNWVWRSALEAARFRPSRALIIQEPRSLSDYDAQELAENTTSRRALEQWHSVETREGIRAAITKRLASTKVKDLPG